MITRPKLLLCLSLLITLIIGVSTFGFPFHLQAKPYHRPIRIVGSGTVFLFSVYTAEAFSNHTAFKTPVIESTGTGVGIKIFCAGKGANTPDVVNASRPMLPHEIQDCHRHGITPLPIEIGHDGIVVVGSSAKKVFSHIGCQDIYRAVGKYRIQPSLQLTENTAKNWHDINNTLPNVPITLYGPSLVSGTRDIFVDLCMKKGAMASPEGKELAEKNPILFQKAAATMREDGTYIEVGDNYNLILEKMKSAPSMLGIMGYNYYVANKNAITALVVDGQAPTITSIQDRTYPLSRPLLFYIKAEHLNPAQPELFTPGLLAYSHFFLSPDIAGAHGILARIGLVPMMTKEHQNQEAILSKYL
jgi:phosphate transport system substrate-binding protein